LHSSGSNGRDAITPIDGTLAFAMQDATSRSSRARSFRARAEQRQRDYRERVLRAGWVDHEHWLDGVAVDAGKNFVVPEAHAAAKARAAGGKGVAERTFQNMLSSQAMCFNIFAPLAQDLVLAAEVMSPLLPELVAVRGIEIEYTPSNAIFRDQSGLGGVDCDLLLDVELYGGVRAVIAIETKLVEPDFSICGFRKPGRAAKGLPVCPEDVPVRADHGACLYSSRKRYLYWEQTRRLHTLADVALDATGCPFGGPEWQLWVNHTLVHAEALSRGAARAIFIVCAPRKNEALLGRGVLDRFRARLAQPDTMRFMAVDDVLDRIDTVTRNRASLRTWAERLLARYGSI
jgi:hypothetical protein